MTGFGLLLVVGEETDSVGAQTANWEPRGSRWLVNGEPTENRLALGSKGMLYLALEAEVKRKFLREQVVITFAVCTKHVLELDDPLRCPKCAEG